MVCLSLLGAKTLLRAMEVLLDLIPLHAFIRGEVTHHLTKDWDAGRDKGLKGTSLSQK